MGICASCLGLNRRSPSPNERTPLLSSRSQTGHHVDLPNSSSSSQPNIIREDPSRLRLQASALEDICSSTADKLIDLSNNFGASKIDSDFARLFGEAFKGGLIIEDDETAETGDDHMNGSADVEKPSDEREWLRNIIAAANQQHKEAGGGGSGTVDLTAVIETDEPLVITFESLEAERRT